MQRWKITVEYDGTDFCGWQKQDNVISVQQVLEEAIEKFSKEKVSITGSGRTDAGVHAMGQVVHFDLNREIEPYKICEAINHFLSEYAVSVIDAKKVDDDFHARFSAKKRTYIYKIINRKSKLAIDKNRAWHFTKELDVKAMQECADMLIGKHDFSTFRASECQSKSPVKSIDKINFKKSGELIVMEISAISFMHHQVRNIIGTLSLVGTGFWTKKDFEKAFKAKDRTKGGVTAPACGLYFKKIEF